MLSKLVDMALTPSEAFADSPMCVGSASKYPYGLSISLDKHSLEKLEVDHTDWEIGDIFDLRAMAKVTSVSEHETENGKECRVELQIIMLGAESESNEGAEEQEPRSRVRRDRG